MRVVDFLSGRIAFGSVGAYIGCPYPVVKVTLVREGKIGRVLVPFHDDGSQVVPRNQGPRFRVIGRYF